jgi:hypothetical protein
MAQPITSPDGTLEITRHSMVYPPMGPKSIQGAVKNNGTENANAEIQVEFYDSSENLLGTSIGVFKDIKPGETRLFDIWAERLPNMYEVEEHKIAYVKKV